MRTLQTFSMIAMLGFVVAGCGKEETTDNGGDGSPSDQTMPYDNTTGQTAHEAKAYPAGPYGIEIGSVVRNYKFVGFPDPSKDTSSAYPIELADFYNPTGTDVYPEGSVYG